MFRSVIAGNYFSTQMREWFIWKSAKLVVNLHFRDQAFLGKRQKYNRSLETNNQSYN